MAVLHDISNAVRELVKSRSDRLVYLEADGYRIGSGTLLDERRIATAAHTVEGVSEIEVRTMGGASLEATLAGWDPGSDIALLTLSEPAAAPAGELGDAVPELGELVLTIAYPSGDGIESALGSVRCAPGSGGSGSAEGDGLPYFQTDTLRFRGFAGGAVFDMDGKLLGVNSFGYGPTAPIVVPAQSVLSIVERIEQQGMRSRGYLGIESQHVELDAGAAERASSIAARAESGNEGLLIVAVAHGSPAATAGLRVGDILIAMGEQAVENHRDLMTQLWQNAGGTDLELTVLRGDAVERLPVTLGDAPEPSGHGRKGPGRHHGHGGGKGAGKGRGGGKGAKARHGRHWPK